MWGVAQGGIVQSATDGQALRVLKERPGGEWLRWVGALALSADGHVVALDKASDNGLAPLPGNDIIAIWRRDGTPLKSVPLPAEFNMDHLDCQAGRVVLWGEGQQILLDIQSGSLSRLGLAGRQESLGLSVDGKELWAVSGDAVLTIYLIK